MFSANKPVIFSGIQPTGNLNIGAYFGALKNWVKLQSDYDCLFSLVDLHAITVRQDPKILREHCYTLLALYLACGLDADKNLLFCQSHVPEHSELAWILNCFTYMGELNRMTQFKDKAKKNEQNVNIGLFAYPVLMAADILLYGTNLVPVGEDQKQHLEITRDIAMRFNNVYGAIFKVPEVFNPPLGARIMSLQEPDKKMSKTDENQDNVIAVLDTPEVIRNKLKRAVTDSGREVRFAEDKPGVANLLTILAVITDKSIATLENEYVGQGYGKFKSDVAESLITFLAPIQKRYHELQGERGELDKILQRSAAMARERANLMLNRVKDAVGFIRI